MKLNLAAMVRRARNPRRKTIPLREIVPPATLATTLFRSCYLPVVQAWEAALPAIMAEYQRSLSQVTTDSAADLDALLSGLDPELRRLFLDITPRLRDWLVRVESWHRGKWRGAVLSATGVDLQTMLGAEDAAETLEAFLARNVSLVKDVSDQARSRISDAVFRGLTNRMPVADVAREIREAVAMSRRRSINIAADQLRKTASALDGERMRQAGIEQFTWRHSGKLHARPWHKARNGRRYALDTGQEVDGSDVIEPDDMPGVPPWCGCRKQAYISFD